MQVVVLVGTNRRNLTLIQDVLREAGFLVRQITSLEEFDAALASQEPMDVAIVDLGGFGPQIWPCCDVLRWRRIPVVVLAPRRDPRIDADSAGHGVSRVLVKPVTPQALLSAVRHVLAFRAGNP